MASKNPRFYIMHRKDGLFSSHLELVYIAKKQELKNHEVWDLGSLTLHPHRILEVLPKFPYLRYVEEDNV